MIAIVETSSASIDGTEFQKLVNTYSETDNSVYGDTYFKSLESYLDAVKASNTRTDPNMSLYAITNGSQKGEIMIIASANEEYSYKDTFVFNDLANSQIIGLEKTARDAKITSNELGNRISACTPILGQQSKPVGALCTDFQLKIVYETRADVMQTLGIAFLIVYPAMIVLVLFATRAMSGIFGRFRKKKEMQS